MKTISCACVVAAALVLWQPPTFAQTAKFRFMAAIYADDKDVGFSLPEGVACNGSGQIVVGDTGNNRLVRFTYQDKTISGGVVIQSPQISAPSRVRLNSKGEIYVLSNTERQIVHFSAEGEFRNVLSFEGAPPPSTIVPKGFTLDAADNIYVADVFGARVLVVNADGTFQRVLPFPASIGFASDVAVDELGNLLLLDSIKRRLFSAVKGAEVFAPLAGNLADAVSTLPTFMDVSKGTTFVIEGSGSRIVTLRRDGSFLARQLSSGREEGSLDQPSQICINDRDEVIIADRDNSRIQIFQLIR